MDPIDILWKRVKIWTAFLVVGNILLSILLNPSALTDWVLIQFLGGWLIALIVAIIFFLTLPGLPEDIQFTWVEVIWVLIIFTLAVYFTNPYNDTHAPGTTLIG